MNLKSILQSRWFPQMVTHLAAGLAASGVVYGLKALGVTSVVPWEVNNALTPLIGFMVAAIVRKPVNVAPDPTPTTPPTGTLGSQVAEMLLGDVREAIDANPAILKSLAMGILLGKVPGARAPQPAPAVPAVVPAPEPPPSPTAPVQEQEAAQEGVIR